MNWKLIFLLSLFGLAMAVLTVYWDSAEFFIWLGIYIFSAIMIAQKAPGRLFLHSFLVGLLNGLLVGIVHYVLFDQYLAAHPEMVDEYAEQPMPFELRTMFLFMGPIIGVISGVALGILTLLAGLLFKRKMNKV